MKVRTILFCAATLVTAAACKEDRAAKIDESVDHVQDQRESLAEQREDLAEADSPGKRLEERAEVAHASADLAKAEVDFERRRDLYVDELRFRHSIYEAQTAVARGMLADPRLATDDRQAATDKVLTFERELNESEQAIDSVATSTPAQWDSVHTTVANAFEQLAGAHDDAFDALVAERDITVGDVHRNAPAATTRDDAEGAYQTTKAKTKDAYETTKAKAKDAYKTTKAKTKGAYNDAVDNGEPGDND